MKTISTCLFLMFIFSIAGFGQFTDKKAAEQTNKKSGSLDITSFEKETFTTSRTEDIALISDYQKKIQVALDTEALNEAEVWKNKALNVMVNEIARSKKNLKEIESGDTKHLEEYQKKNAPNYPLNIDLEKRNLTNRINYMHQVFKNLNAKDITKLTNERDLMMTVGSINGFKRAMERNLRYESDQKSITGPGSVNQGIDNETYDGPAIITKKKHKEQIGVDDPRVQSWLNSKDQRMTDFAKNKAEFRKYANANDDNMARRSYQSLVQLMMDEINASNWLIGQVGMGNIEKGSFDTNSLAAKVQKQQPILKEARNIKVSTPETLKANKSRAFDLINAFEKTLN